MICRLHPAMPISNHELATVLRSLDHDLWQSHMRNTECGEPIRLGESCYSLGLCGSEVAVAHCRRVLHMGLAGISSHLYDVGTLTWL
jgi:hypothetical protein